MRRYLILLLLVALVLAIALPAMAGGLKNTTYVKFYVGATAYDSYWQATPSGVIHEWRTTDSYHFVFKPIGPKFLAPDCQTRLYDAYGNDIGPNPDFVSAFSFNFAANYNLYYVEDTTGIDDADLDEVLPLTTYWVCLYHW